MTLDDYKQFEINQHARHSTCNKGIKSVKRREWDPSSGPLGIQAQSIQLHTRVQHLPRNDPRRDLLDHISRFRTDVFERGQPVDFVVETAADEDALLPALGPNDLGILAPRQQTGRRAGIVFHVVEGVAREIVVDGLGAGETGRHEGFDSLVEVDQCLVEGQPDKGLVQEEGEEVPGGDVVSKDLRPRRFIGSGEVELGLDGDLATDGSFGGRFLAMGIPSAETGHLEAMFGGR